MHNIRLVQLGLGGVGSAFLQQYLGLPPASRAGLDLVAVADVSGAIRSDAGLAYRALAAALSAATSRQLLSTLPGSVPLSQLDDLPAGVTIVADITASDATLPLLRRAVASGGGVVLANKRPVAATQAIWHELARGGHLRYEATVGAGLPVIYTLRYLTATGDRVLRVEGALSGTLGYLFSRIEAGDSFSTALRSAYQQRYTEPDPRDDLGGMDVARKALVLARTIGLELEPADISVQALYPDEMSALSVPDFLAQAERLDDSFRRQREQAESEGKVLRYLAQVARDNVSIGLSSVPADSPFAALRGADNLIVIHTERYTSPMRIAGPGAGTQVTAAAVLADVLDLATSLRAEGCGG